MSLPRSTRYLVIGAGIHGLSTAYHLAKELRTRGLGSGSDILVVDKTGPGCRRIGHRLRRRPQQLLPARDVRADAGVRRGLGVGSRGLRVQPGRLHRARPGAPGVGPHAGLRAAPADRLPVRAHPRRGRGRRAHEGALPRLACEERDGLPARAAGRVRVQPRLGAGPRRQVRVRGRHDPVGCRGHRLRVAERPGRHRRRDQRGDDRRRARRRRPGPVGEALLEPARPAHDARRADAHRRRRAEPVDVDVLEPAGGRDPGRPEDVLASRRQACPRSCTSTRTRRCARTTAS